MTTATYSNRNESVEVEMDGMAAGVSPARITCVRRTTDGRWAVIACAGHKLYKILADRLHARRYNFSMHGLNLGE